MSPSLLSLPRELRDQIYNALWLSTPKISLLDHPSQGRILLSYTSLPGHQETPLPTWLLTCKTLLAEGTAQMTRHGSCIVRLRSEYPVRAGGVLAPPHARRITITLTQPLEGPRPAWPHVVREPVLRVSRENAKCLARVAGHLSSVERRREVRVVLELVREEAGARIDLSALEALCGGSEGFGLGIERLEVVVLREQVYRAWSEGFVEAVGDEVKRVGNRIMGSDEDPSVSGVFGDRGFVYAFEKVGGMGLCRVDSAVDGEVLS